ncbi:hypothetical protein GGE67_002659 [Rhizobium leucaenae]|uniref:Uncharacterized protein n=1 Tax=Rhizobium leucaenae TaxID=29450 RepID=A0A7W6ZUA9_9HYPH|nr:hypothetical protein [Rhizobium leucaenae]MBB6302040.1 hypothetical protein [Rhizobium leucaenae]
MSEVRLVDRQFRIHAVRTYKPDGGNICGGTVLA